MVATSFCFYEISKKYFGLETGALIKLAWNSQISHNLFILPHQNNTKNDKNLYLLFLKLNSRILNFFTEIKFWKEKWIFLIKEKGFNNP
jgi:hypothetical protein